MMDLKEIIKWFIPCFHVLQVILKSKSLRLTFFCLFIFICVRCTGASSIGMGNDTKYLGSDIDKLSQSDVTNLVESRSIGDASVGRTFGLRFRKMIGSLLPLVFQIGAASTWAVVAAIVGVKTLLVTLVILKLLLIAGAAKVMAVAVQSHRPTELRQHLLPQYQLIFAMSPNNTMPQTMAATEQISEMQSHTKEVHSQKFGALFAHKSHKPEWQPPHPQKEIHLHIHNGHHDTHEEHVPVYGSWSREDPTSASQKVNAVDPYSMVGPQTIKTPFGNYMKIESADPIYTPTKRR